MSIDIACPNCGRLIFAPRELAGQELLCPGCGKPVPVACPEGAPSATEEPIPVACPNCNASIRLVPKLLGRRVFCNTCRAALQVSLALKRIDDSTVSPPEPMRETLSQETLVRARCSCGMQLKTLKEFSAEDVTCPGCGRLVRFTGREADQPRRAMQESEREALTPPEECSQPADDLVFGLPEVAEDPFPATSECLNSSEISQPTHVGRDPDWQNEEHEVMTRAQPIGSLEYGAVEIAEDRPSASVLPPSLPKASVEMEEESEHATIEQEEVDVRESDEIDLDFPETSLPVAEEASSEATTGPIPLTPHEATMALRDHEIGAALRRIQTGYVPEVEEPAARGAAGTSRDDSVSGGTAPWAWPLIAAIGATCMMLTSLYYILYVM